MSHVKKLASGKYQARYPGLRRAGAREELRSQAGMRTTG